MVTGTGGAAAAHVYEVDQAVLRSQQQGSSDWLDDVDVDVMVTSVGEGGSVNDLSKNQRRAWSGNLRRENCTHYTALEAACIV